MIKKTDQAIIQGHLEDSSNLTGAYADGLYLPESAADAATAVKECTAKKTPLTIVGGATGTTGGCLPFGGWLLATEKLNRIITLDEGNKFAIVEPGVTLDEIEAAVKPMGLLYPPDPTEKTATIGGNVATNASGGRGYRFGATRDWIRRLKVILPSGEILNVSGGEKIKSVIPKSAIPIPHYLMPPTKNTAGYFAKPEMDLVDLFIGAEGTLGIVTEIEIALMPAMKETFDLVAFFPSEDKAVDFVFQARKQNDTTINFFEFFDANTLQMLKSSYPHIPENAKAAVYIEQEITEDNKNGYLDFWAKLLKQFHASLDNCWLGIELDQKAELAKFRHAIPEHINELFKQNHLVKLATDIAVPTDKFREMFNFYNSELITPNSELFSIKFGHIGENHLHVNLLPKTEEQKKLADDLIMRFVKKAVSLGGTVSAEHGIGKIKHQYLREMYGPQGIKEMIDVKKHFDPNLILNRNNIFPFVP